VSSWCRELTSSSSFQPSSRGAHPSTGGRGAGQPERFVRCFRPGARDRVARSCSFLLPKRLACGSAAPIMSGLRGPSARYGWKLGALTFEENQLVAPTERGQRVTFSGSKVLEDDEASGTASDSPEFLVVRTCAVWLAT